MIDNTSRLRSRTNRSLTHANAMRLDGARQGLGRGAAAPGTAIVHNP